VFLLSKLTRFVNTGVFTLLLLTGLYYLPWTVFVFDISMVGLRGCVLVLLFTIGLVLLIF
jgi:hypothetical protein